MQLVYAENERANFGDELNTVVWPALFPSLFDGDPATGFVGIGTIIGMPVGALDTLHVFSSGVGYDVLSRWEGKTVRYWCVRGRLSAKALGLPTKSAISDGAYLCPLIDGLRPADAWESVGAVVIPHVDSIQFAGWSEACTLAGLTLLDPRGPPRKVVGEIAGAKLVLTESLHGAIIADAYGVPWIPFASSKNFSTIKWADWLSGLDVRPAMSGVPPPTPRIPAKYGRLSPSLNDDVAAFLDGRALLSLEGEDAPQRRFQIELKAAAAKLPGVAAITGMTPDRTAEALDKLSRRDPTISSRTRVAAFQERLLSKAKEFAEATGTEVNARIVA